MTFGGGKNAVQVRIVGDASQFKKETKSAEKSSQTLVGTLKKHAGLIKGFLAVSAARAVKDFVSGSVRAFSDLNESINAVEVTFGDAADGVLALGENAAESLGLANAEFNTLAVGFAAFVQQIAAEKDGDVAATMDELTTRVADFASVMNIDVTEAADKFRSGLAGETEPLRKFGLDVSAAAVNVRGLELGLGGATGKLSEQEKVLARYNLIMEQTEKTAGDFANTSDDLANRQRILTARFTDMQAEIGANLVPAMEALLGLGENLIPVIGTLGTAFGGLTGTLNISAEALDNFEKEHGRAAETTREVVGAIRDEADARRNWADFLLFGIGPLEATTKALRKHLQTTELSTDQLEEFRVEIEGLGDDNKLTAEQVDFLNDVLDDLQGVLGNEVLKATQDVRDAVLDGLDPALGGLADTTDEAADSVDNLADSMLAAADPAFNLTKTTADAAEAQTKLNDVRDEFGVGSSQFLEAANAAAEATARQNAAQQTFNEEFGPQSEETFRILLAAAGLYGEEIEAIIEALFRAASATRNLPNLQSGGTRAGPSGIVRHTGGRVNAPRGQEVLARVLGGEEISNPAHNSEGLNSEGIARRVLELLNSEGLNAEGIFQQLTEELNSEGLNSEGLNSEGIARRLSELLDAEGAPVLDAEGAPVLDAEGRPVLDAEGRPVLDAEGRPVLNAEGGEITINVNGFVGSELALAAEIDRLLTRRSRSSPLGFQ